MTLAVLGGRHYSTPGVRGVKNEPPSAAATGGGTELSLALLFTGDRVAFKRMYSEVLCHSHIRFLQMIIKSEYG